MSEPSPFALKPDRALPRWGLLALAVLVLSGAAALFTLPASPGVALTASEITSAEDRAYLVSVQAPSSAERIDVPRLGVRVALRGGRGEFRVRAEDLADAGGPLTYILREPWYRADRRGKVAIAGLPDAPAADVASTEAPGDLMERGSSAPDGSPAVAEDVVTAPPEPAVAPPNTPPAVDEAPPAPPRSAWSRDRALESELAGRGVAGVSILRRGRSIRLRGTVGTDQALRTVYQFMNDKGFGEVSYGVEVR